jgi:hypothetical protein
MKHLYFDKEKKEEIKRGKIKSNRAQPQRHLTHE